MHRHTHAGLIVLLSLTGLAKGADTSAIDECLAALEERTRQSDFENAEDVLDERSEVERVCEEAEEILRAQEQQVREYERLAARLEKDAGLGYLANLYREVDALVLEAHASFQALAAIPLTLSPDSMTAMRDVELRILNVRSRHLGYSASWDQLHHPPAGSDLDSFLALGRADSISPESVVDNVQAFSSSLPTFVLGREPAPKTKLRQLEDAAANLASLYQRRSAAMQALLADRAYSGIRDAARVEIDKLNAERVRQAITREIGTTLDVQVEVRLGACYSARDRLERAVRVLETAVARTPAAADSHAAFAKSLEEFRGTAGLVDSCPTSAAQGKLMDTLRQSRRLIDPIVGECAKRDPSRQERLRILDERIVDIDRSLALQESTAAMREVVHRSAERSLDDIRTLRLQCQPPQGGSGL